MSKKILSVLLTVGLISTLLTGCVSFSYGNPVAEKKYAVEMPNGEVYELTEEEAKELLSMQGELQRELGLSDEEMEQLREELYILLGYEEQEVESEEVQTEEFEEPTEEESVEVETSTEEQQTEIETVTEETQEETATIEEESKIECLDDVMGLRLDGFEFMGVHYDIYSEGAVFGWVEDDVWMIQETVPYGDKEVPVVCVSNISEEGFELPASVQYLGSPIEDYEGYIGYFYNGKNIEIPEQIKYFNCSMSDSDVESFKILSDKTQVPDYIKGWFINCKSLKTVSLPDTIEGFRGTHKNGTFEGCESLSEIELPSNLKIIGAKTFKDCSSLTNISIPEGVTTIGEEAFAGTNITSIEYPEGLTCLALNAFSNTSIEELIVPESVTDINGAISNMPNLKTLIIPDTITMYKSFSIWNCPSLELVVFPDTVTDFSIRAESDFDKSKITIKVSARIAEYLQEKYPEYNIVAKD